MCWKAAERYVSLLTSENNPESQEQEEPRIANHLGNRVKVILNNPLQHSCLENPVDRGAWRAAVHRVIESQARTQCKITSGWIG